MKALFKLSDKRHYLLIIAGLALAAYLVGVLSASTQVTTAPAKSPATTTATASTTIPATAVAEASTSPTTPGVAVADATTSTTTPGVVVADATTSTTTPGVAVADATTPATTSGTAVAETTTSTTNSSATSTTTPAKSANDPKAATTLPTQSEVTASEASAPDYTNWVTLGVGGDFVSGDKAQFQQQQNTKYGLFGGVDDFHWQQFVGKSATLTVDGHAITGKHDYDFHLDLTDPTLGYIRAGFTDYRIWYDGNGGFDPEHDQSYSLFDNNLYIDRMRGCIEAGLTLPDWPTLAFRYEYDSRKGQMSSTEWGTDPGGQSITPTLLYIDETQNIFQGDISDKVDDTNFGLTLRYEMDRTNDSYDYEDVAAGAPTFWQEDDVEKNDIFNTHGFTETFFDDKVTFTSGFSASTIQTTLGGNELGSSSASHNFFNLTGGGNSTEYVGNMSLMLTPIKDLVFVPAVRLEFDNSNLADSSLSTAHATTQNYDNQWESSVAQSLEARYTGFTDWSLYASGEWSEDWGNEAWYTEPAAIMNPVLNQDWNRFCQKYTIGANWYPLAQLNFGAQYYHQIHDYDYQRGLLTVATTYPNYLQKQNFTTDDMNFRATWQALSNVALVTRYDFQYSTVDTWSIPDPGKQAGGVQSSNITDSILSESVNWTPLTSLYLQAGGSYVLNSVNTPAAQINNIITNGENNYWTLDASVGYAFDSKTDLQLEGTYYASDNYVSNMSASLPFGASDEEESITATLTHKINKAVKVSLQYGYYRYRDATDAGMDNYNANVVYLSTQFGF